jgi:hypothetical protein
LMRLENGKSGRGRAAVAIVRMSFGLAVMRLRSFAA